MISSMRKCAEPSVGRIKGRVAVTTLLLLLLCSCATTDQTLVLAPVGPPPKSASHGKEGYLQVFSATTPVNDGGIQYLPHSSYRIYRPDGQFVKAVRNHMTQSDQAPQRVVLPAGEYYVVAAAEGFGVVKVPVLIKGAQLTLIYLDQTEPKDLRVADEKLLVHLPNGRIVGWRSKPAQP
ncbi:MAG TPA: hypothetical protein VEC99_08065 [Clostridia bacterium]|nr:hypothetical protein [Clostridia bacterium]